MCVLCALPCLQEERDMLVDKLLATTEALHASEARNRQSEASQNQVSARWHVSTRFGSGQPAQHHMRTHFVMPAGLPQGTTNSNMGPAHQQDANMLCLTVLKCAALTRL